MTSEFLALAQSSAKALGYPELPMVVLPHPFEAVAASDVKRLAEEKLDDICGRLTVPIPAPS